jgi:formyltetrahydrofolate deformylase
MGTGVDARGWWDTIPVPPGGKAVVKTQAFELLDAHHVDLVVFARYMQVVSPEFIERYPSRIINIHRSSCRGFAGTARRRNIG